MNKKNIAIKWLWCMQGLLAITTYLLMDFISFILYKTFFIHDYNSYILAYGKYLISNAFASQLPGTIVLLFIAVGSFFKWRLTIIANIAYSYVTVRNIVTVFFLSDHNNISTTWIGPISNIAIILSFSMNIIGFILFIKMVYYLFRKQK